MKQTIKLLPRVIGIVVLALLSGCIYPHTTPRSDDVRGRVLDAITRKPIQGAKVYFVSSPHHPVYTDDAGYFHRKPTHNFHMAGVPPDGVWPENKDSNTEITHPHYKPVWGDWTGDAGDILLAPEQ
jgi:hypothetical protein